MERTYTDEQLEAMKGENNTITYDGKEYDGYQATQEQRRIERTIRKYRRLEESYNSAGLTDKGEAARTTINRLEEKYKEFSKAAGLKTHIERKKVLY